MRVARTHRHAGMIRGSSALGELGAPDSSSASGTIVRNLTISERRAADPDPVLPVQQRTAGDDQLVEGHHPEDQHPQRRRDGQDDEVEQALEAGA